MTIKPAFLLPCLHHLVLLCPEHICPTLMHRPFRLTFFLLITRPCLALSYSRPQWKNITYLPQENLLFQLFTINILAQSLNFLWRDTRPERELVSLREIFQLRKGISDCVDGCLHRSAAAAATPEQWQLRDETQFFTGAIFAQRSLSEGNPVTSHGSQSWG